MKLVVTLILALLLPACSPEPKVTLDLRLLDGVPAVPIQTPVGACTALLLSDGSLLTCSHAIPRNEPTGDLRVAGLLTRYTVLASGDNLEHTWSTSGETVPEGTHEDWSLLSTTPKANAADYFHPLIPAQPTPSTVRLGETVYIVAYTVEHDPGAQSSRLIRHWVPVVVINPPHRFANPNEPIIWLHTASADAAFLSMPASQSPAAGHPDVFTSHGFSGAPVIRQKPDGSLETIAIMVSGVTDLKTNRSRYGIAIPIPGGLHTNTPYTP